MGLPVTIPMSKSFNGYPVRVVHLEPTDVCNAACPQCLRELDQYFSKQTQHHLTVNHIQQLLSPEDIAQLDKMFMCGNYGDPAAASHVFDLYQHFRTHNPTIVLGMNTNGSLRTPQWWRELAAILNQPHDYVVFSIDGLADTNHIYRVNTVWAKLMENAQAFIDAGGSAHWDMLVFRHNEHQVDAAQELAQQMGFKWFRAKVSKRPAVGKIDVPVNWIKPENRTGPIKCISESEQSVYIDAQGRISPCCWQGPLLTPLSAFDQLRNSWASSTPDLTCAKVCRVDNNQLSRFKEQWQREIEFK